MATQRDIQQINKLLGMLPRPESALIVGAREEYQRLSHEAVLDCYVFTLDIDEGLDPTVLYDLNSDKPIPGKYEVIICSNTLMYLEKPRIAVERMLEATTGALIICEPAIRKRAPETTTTKDGKTVYSDINRFSTFGQFDWPIYTSISVEDLSHHNATYKSYDPKTLIKTKPSSPLHYYWNPAPYLEVLWQYNKIPT